MNEEKTTIPTGEGENINEYTPSENGFVLVENTPSTEESMVSVENTPSTGESMVSVENTPSTEESMVSMENTQPVVAKSNPVEVRLVDGYSVTGNNTNQNQYKFWQQQTGGQSSSQYFSNASQVPPVQEKPEKKREYKLFKKIGTGILVGLAAGVGFCVIVYGANKLGIVNHTTTEENAKVENSIASTVVSTGNQMSTPNDLTSVVDKCMPSIVSINSTVTSTYNSFFGSYDQDSTGSGSGIVLKISDDEILIATNNHVIADAKKIVVGFNGTESDEDMIEAVVKGTDSTHDLAVVVVKTKNVPEKIMKNIAAADLGDSESAKVGEMAIAIGNSLGYGQSLTVGYISAKDRKVEVEEGTMNLLQTDAAINPGNSGGALLNPEGEVIGINSAKYSDTAVEGMGFAIPISEAIPIINDLMEREVLTEEEKGYLGISCTNITADSQYANMPQGVYVSEVSPDGAAYEAGIVAGDIIIGVDDLDITTSEELSERINSYRIGTKVTIKVMRYSKGEYEKKKIEVTLKGKESLESITEPEEQAGTNQNGSAGNGQQNPGQDSQGEDNQEQQNPYGNQIDPYGNGGYSDEEMEEFYRYFYGQ